MIPSPTPNRAQRVILASHLVFTGYGHWLSNDPRGSGSEEIRKDELKDLGEIHHGRKRIQPPRSELREFYREAQPLLEHETLWFDERMRQTIAGAIGRCARERGYTLWALAVCRNHLHALPRAHRDHAEVIWENLARATREALVEAQLVPNDHPVWSHRVYKVFKHTPTGVRDGIGYIEDNPEKEGLPRQYWECVVPYRG